MQNSGKEQSLDDGGMKDKCKKGRIVVKVQIGA
jgi:hypothetical protein